MGPGWLAFRYLLASGSFANSGDYLGGFQKICRITISRVGTRCIGGSGGAPTSTVGCGGAGGAGGGEACVSCAGYVTDNKGTLCENNGPPSSGMIFDTYGACICDTGCKTECATTSCANPPANPDAACDTCVKAANTGACKTEYENCSNDAF
jgi:hypothetical protein